MEPLVQITFADSEFVRIVDAASGEAARRSGEWIACRPGCNQCCMGPFEITALDALRLRNGLRKLEAADPERAERVRRRTARYVARLAAECPADPAKGTAGDPDRWPDSWDDVPCPALDPGTGCCDLYEARPITCRAFGPAVRTRGGDVAACELCYAGVPDEEIARCAVEIDPEDVEGGLLYRLESAGAARVTTVAFALTEPPL